jgi:hypothetical protein
MSITAGQISDTSRNAMSNIEKSFPYEAVIPYNNASPACEWCGDQYGMGWYWQAANSRSNTAKFRFITAVDRTLFILRWG